ncbi:MAG: LapA family protein [Deltaproteobacteria bacterium]|nr:LapA family protein [Deltaproteobacteria bacterium]MBW2334605.1 LapA family protein [Deltaproteobacteria bacterium]
MKHIKAIISIVLMLLAVVLIVENLTQLSQKLILKIDLYFWDWSTEPMAFYFVIIIVFLLGILMASLYGIFERFKLKKEIRIISKEKREKDKELNSLRNLPIVESKIEDMELSEENQD